MRKIWLNVLIIGAIVAAAVAPLAKHVLAQDAGHSPRGTATDIPNDLIKSTLTKTASAAVSDQQIKVVSINGDYNVGVGILHRAHAESGSASAGGALTHEQITEVYHIISGTGTLVTGGKIQNAKALAPDNVIVTTLAGPGATGGPISGGVSMKVGPGDIIVIPPNTPHWFSAVDSDQIVYLAVRMDPHHVLPAGYPDHVLKESAKIAANVPEGTATEVKKEAVEGTMTNKGIDTQLKIVGINNEYNIAIGALHRPHVEHATGGALEHEYVTEVYHIISGSGTYVTGGTIDNAKEAAADNELVTLLDGPSMSGGVAKGGVSRHVGPGDVIIIPPNTPHWFSDIDSDKVEYLVVRIDPRKLLPSGYVAPPTATGGFRQD
jgi:mannose-6-phosphate isomerase-like protein (cupin superfamily)